MLKRKTVIYLTLSVFLFLETSLAYAAGLTIGSGASVNINDASLKVPNNIAVNGTMTVGTGSISIGGSWANSGTFTAGTGTVSFIDGTTPASISGTDTFYNLKAVTTSGKQINFEAGKTQTVANTLTLQGASSNLLTLRSTVDGQQAVINLQNGGTQSITYVDVKDHSASGQYLAPGPPASFNSIDSGNNTRWFNPVSSVDTTPPANPSNLNAASNSDGSITLSWAAPSDTDLSGYNIYRDGTKINSSLVKTSSYKDTGTVNVSTYTYKVTSLDLAGNESSGATKTATSAVQANTPPSAPSNVKAEDTGTGYSLKVVWTANTESDLSGYKVYWGTASGAYANSQIVENATSYAITGLTEGTKYYITVTAYDTEGNESAKSIEATGTPKAYASKPEAPTGLTVTPGNKYLALSWTGVSNVTGYMVYIGETDGVYGTPVRTANSTYTFQNLENNKTYYVAVSSYDMSTGSRYTISSESERTASSGAPYDNDPPATPSGLTATDDGTGGKVALKWTREESFDIAGYVVAYKESGAAVFSDIVSTGVKWSHTITGLINGTEYTFYVYAYDGNGNFSDPASVTATPSSSGSTADVTPPGIPILSAAPGNGRVTLMITPPSDTDIAHYNLYVYNLAAGKYMPLASMNGLSYEHSTGVDNGKALVFVATAVDSSGNESGYSTTASAVPNELPGDIPLEEDPPVLDRVDGYDVNEIAKGFGSGIGNPNYNPNADLDGNGKIDGNDLLILGTNHGKKKE